MMKKPRCYRLPSLFLGFAVVLIVFAASANPHAQADDMNVLIIGSTQSFSDTESSLSSVVHEKAFNPTAISTNLQSILSQDPAITETVNVEFENIYKTKGMIVPIGGSGSAWSFTFRCYSLAQHFMWPENKATRMADLRGEGDLQWDYIVLCEDPYIMTNFPGMYANPHFPALRSDPLALSGASRGKQIPSRSLSFKTPNSTQLGSAVLYLQDSSDLGITDPWSNHTIPVPDVSGVVSGVEFFITPINGTDHNQVEVTIPASAAGGVGKIFARL